MLRDATHDHTIELEARIKDLEDRLEKLEAEIGGDFEKDIKNFLAHADLSDPCAAPKPKVIQNDSTR